MGVRKWLLICIIAIAVGVLVNFLYEEEILPDTIRMTTQAREGQVEQTQEEKSLIQVHEHTFVKNVWESATCEKSGYYTKVCSECGLEENVQEAPLAHETEAVVVQEGNCMEDTIIRYVCKYCQQQIGQEIRYTEVEIHDPAESNVDGVIITYCLRCGVTL